MIDTGLFDEDKYFDVDIEYAKADVDDILLRITATNRGPQDARLHVLPQVWFRNTWDWSDDAQEAVAEGDERRRDRHRARDPRQLHRAV